ncbi:3-oxoacyl-[acyl-carrier-protein] reductase FabG-like [Cylas formicarius]|uniref:3-oxoacyl-[acyl-carrier-protein] reductase FabG-like n=1 Tax=Cylas formicarius TaxID=197179 RepID=UPI0029587F74|nr:3-oxoacyl-[acyl-carrier-protein] reductase FabG-like [Cylas formicarius]
MEATKRQFDGKVVVITGAGGGIGAAAAILFAKLGASMTLQGSSNEDLHAVVKECEKTHVIIMPSDITNEEHRKAMIDKTIERFGRLDVLVNNVGIWESGSIETTTLGQFDRVMDVNVKSVFHLTTLAVPHLVKTKGNIVNVSSLTGIRAMTGMVAYCVSKATLDQFTRCIAVELASKHVRVNSVNPGVIATDFYLKSGMSREQYEAFVERCKTTHAMGRVGKPEEIASAIVYLASDGAGFITGVNLSVDGGKAVTCPR